MEKRESTIIRNPDKQAEFLLFLLTCLILSKERNKQTGFQTGYNWKVTFQITENTEYRLF